MKLEKIKETPKYMLKLMKKLDKEKYPTPTGKTRYYSYLTKNDGELVQVIVAVKEHKGNWYHKQVAIHGINSPYCFARDMLFYYMGGYQVGWYDKGITRTPKWYEDGTWGKCYPHLFNPYSTLINGDYIKKIPLYKYSGAEKISGKNFLDYLKTYQEYPVLEMLGKLELDNLYKSKTLIKKLSKDKAFRKWIFRNQDEIRRVDAKPSLIIECYQKEKSVELQHNVKEISTLTKADGKYKHLPELFEGNIERLVKYLMKQKSNIHSYADYIDACTKLGLDLSLPKTYIPHDLKYWHDYRIDEYCTQHALTDETAKAEHYQQFANVSQKYDSLQHFNKNGLSILLAQSPADLFREGKFLHHCVGGGAYDQRFIREESLIFFLRKTDELQTPYATIEFSLTQKKILQFYIFNDKQPTPIEKNFVHNQWLPYATRQLKQIA